MVDILIIQILRFDEKRDIRPDSSFLLNFSHLLRVPFIPQHIIQHPPE